MKSAILERELKNEPEELNLLTTALTRFPDYPKLWLMLAQYHERHDEQEARRTYMAALENCPKSTPIWIGLSRLEEKLSGVKGCRAILEKARIKNPNSADLWIEAIRNEIRYTDGDTQLAMNMLFRALKDCPASGRIWAEMIELEEPQAKKSRCVDALKKCDNDGYVLVSVAKLFWESGNAEKARMWLTRAITEDPKLGDAWVAAYQFEVRYGTEETQQDIIKKCKIAEPKYGEKWISVSKKIENSNMKIEDILKSVVKIYYPYIKKETIIKQEETESETKSMDTENEMETKSNMDTENDMETTV